MVGGYMHLKFIAKTPAHLALQSRVVLYNQKFLGHGVAKSFFLRLSVLVILN
jgi:hypothetical protein